MEEDSVAYEQYAEDEIQQWASADYARRAANHLQVRENINTAIETQTKPAILLVEDNELIQKINRFYLLSLGCEVLLAKTGKEALNYMRDHFDLVILDIGLPDMSGVDVAKDIRKSERHGRTPIVALTALSRDIFTPCYAAGMNEVTQKPLPIEEMYTILHRLLPNYQKVLEIYWMQNQQNP